MYLHVLELPDNSDDLSETRPKEPTEGILESLSLFKCFFARYLNIHNCEQC